MAKYVRIKNGFTLVEIAIILSIVGLVIGGIWLAASTVSNNMKKTDFAKDIVQIIQNIKTLYAQQTVFTDLSELSAAAGGVFPSNLVVRSGGTVTQVNNRYNGRFTLQAAGVGNTQFLLQADNIPADACIELISGRLGQTTEAAQTIGLAAIQVNTAPVPIPVTPANAADACNQLQNTLSMTFGK